MAEFQKGWRVLVHLPTRDSVVVGTVGDTVQRKKITKRVPWVWVNVEGHWQLVRQEHLEPKTDEHYCVEFRKVAEGLSVIRRKTKEGERVYLENPNSEERGYLKALRGSGWKYKGASLNRFWEKVLDETFERLTAKAASKSAGM